MLFYSFFSFLKQAISIKSGQSVNFHCLGFELIASGKHLKAGDMWIYEPNEVSNVEFLSDVDLIIVRWPSIPSDKYDV